LAARRLREQQVEARRVAEALRAALARDGADLLDGVERSRIEEALATLDRVADGTDTAAILDGIRALETACAVFVERRMNRSIQSAMTGHSVDDFKELDK
jgi:molecular chaperone HscA